MAPASGPTVETLAARVARRSAERALADRHASSVEEVQRALDATYRLVERTGSVEPSLRDILRESALSRQAFYKHFRSKDELMLVLVDDGRRRLVGYLAHRMAKAGSPESRVRAWIEGVLAQAADPEAAARTRPFLANQDRLAERFPHEQHASVELIIGLLEAPVEELAGSGPRARRQADVDATAIYHLTFGAMHQHVKERTRPSAEEIDELVEFSLAALRRGP
jgi:AcrR family transcriptional regulator